MSAMLFEDDARISIRALEEVTSGFGRRDFAVRLWDGTTWGDNARPRFTLVLKHPGALRNMFTSPSELVLGEAFIYDDFDIEGNVEAAFDFADYLLVREWRIGDQLRVGSLLRKLPAGIRAAERGHSVPELGGALHSKQRDRRAVTYHYDVSNEFYALWLDHRLVYSCGYFKSASDDLDTAQEQKLDYICRKLRLRRGDRLLDLGCGWGGLMEYAVTHYGVYAFGVTLSVPQAELARERFRLAGIADRCRVEVSDYRELETSQQYDKIVSVGMFEHVGEALLPEYFGQAWALLRPGGVFLNHGIAASATFQRKGPSFVDEYVFPDAREAVSRLFHPLPVKMPLTLAIACIALVANIGSVLLLRRHHAHDLNVRSAFLHLLQDALSSLVVVIATAFAHTRFGPYLDPIAAMVVGCAVIFGAASIIREAVSTLLEGTPKGVDIEDVVSEVEQQFQPVRLHHVHIWEVGPGQRALTAHFTASNVELADAESLCMQIRSFLSERWGIQHATLQPEVGDCGQTGLLGSWQGEG